MPLDISLLPSSTTVRASERHIIRDLTSRGKSLVDIENALANVLRTQFERLDKYKFIIFDCAPGISPFTAAAITISNLVLVPTVCDAASFYGLAAYIETVHSELSFSGSTKLPHLLITRYQEKPREIKAWSWQKNKAKEEKIRHQKRYFDKIQELASQPNPRFKVLNTKIYESPLMPHAMSLGALDEPASPTLGQKYGNMSANLSKLGQEILEVLT